MVVSGVTKIFGAQGEAITCAPRKREKSSHGSDMTLYTPVCTGFDAAVDAILTFCVGDYWRHLIHLFIYFKNFGEHR